MDGGIGNDQAKVVNLGEGNMGLHCTFQLFLGFQIKSMRETTFPYAPRTKQKN